METDIQSSALTDYFSPARKEKLNNLSPRTYCIHRSWGFGQIKEWDQNGHVIIDFLQKKGHPMQFQYAAETLTPLEPKHILVQAADQPDALRTKAKENPVQVIRDCIESLGEAATAAGIQKALSPEIIPAAGWKKWWEGCKRALKKDGHFSIPTKKTEPFRILDEPNA